MHLFAEHEYGLSVAFAGSFFAVMGWAIGLLGGYITGFELYKDDQEENMAGEQSGSPVTVSDLLVLRDDLSEIKVALADLDAKIATLDTVYR